MVLKFEPWGDDPVFDWDDANQKEISRHKVQDFEVEECFRNKNVTIPHKKYQDRYVIRGITNGGRRLVIIVQYLGADWVRPITAWDEKR